VGARWLLLLLALALCGVSGYRLYQKNNGKSRLKELSDADESDRTLTRFGYSPNAYKSLGSALKD